MSSLNFVHNIPVNIKVEHYGLIKTVYERAGGFLTIIHPEGYIVISLMIRVIGSIYPSAHRASLIRLQTEPRICFISEYITPGLELLVKFFLCKSEKCLIVFSISLPVC